MPVQKIRLGTEDNKPLFHYHCPDGHMVYSGPNITGIATVTHPDGTEFHYDVNDLWTEVFAGHQIPLAQAITQRFVDEGHPAHNADVPFVATPVDLTHEPDGTPKESFAELVHAHAVAGKDSSPQALIDAASAAYGKRTQKPEA